MDSIWELFQKAVTDNSATYTYQYIPFEMPEMDPLEVYGSYFRITLCQMFLEASRKWFVDLFPAAHTIIHLQYANYDPVELVHITPVPEQNDLSKGIMLNYPVTGQIPWNGGTLEIYSGLVSLHGPDKLKAAVDVLASFSSLVTGPIAQAVTVAGKIATSAQGLVTGNGGNVVFTYHQTYTDNPAGNPLRPGYFAAILATQDDLKSCHFTVVNDQLKSNGKDFTGHHFLLFRIDGVKERKDWRLKEVQANIEKAHLAYIRKKLEEGDGYKGAAQAAVYESPDLSEWDKTRIDDLITQQLEPSRQRALGAAVDLDAKKSFDLEDLRPNAMSWEDARKIGRVHKFGG